MLVLLLEHLELLGLLLHVDGVALAHPVGSVGDLAVARLLSRLLPLFLLADLSSEQLLAS